MKKEDEMPGDDSTSEQLHSTLNELIEMYKDNTIVYTKLIHNITTTLPETLSNLNNLQIAREERKDKFNKETILFISSFMDEQQILL